MKTPMILLAGLGLMLLGTASAALVKIHTRHDRLDLKDGRRFENVVVQTYDTTTDRVMVLVDGKEATTVPLTALPDEVATLVRERIPLKSEDKLAAEIRQDQEHAEPGPSASELARHARAGAAVNREVRREPEMRRAETAAGQERRMEVHIATAAREYARHHFTYEADPHSSTGRVYEADVIVDSVEPVSGWTDRWRVRGKVGLSYVTRNIGAMGRESKDFELLIEAPVDGPTKLVDITVNP